MERSSTKNGYISMAFLALQFGLQPILSKEFASNVKFSSSLVVSCEIVKLSTALCILIASGKVHKIWSSWNLFDSLRCSGLPACTYAIQNVLIQISYQNLPPIVFNLVNQTKLLWTAVFVYVLLNRKFSFPQCGTL
jgi:UDP-sugar transporter A1/2/3